MLMPNVGGRLMHCGVLTLALAVSAVDSQVGREGGGTFSWGHATPAEMGMDAASLRQARDYAMFDRADPHQGGSGFITRRGKLVLAWGSPAQLYQVKSASKAIGVTALGVAMQDGRMSLTDRATGSPPVRTPPLDGWTR